MQANKHVPRLHVYVGNVSLCTLCHWLRRLFPRSVVRRPQEAVKDVRRGLGLSQFSPSYLIFKIYDCRQIQLSDSKWMDFCQHRNVITLFWSPLTRTVRSVLRRRWNDIEYNNLVRRDQTALQTHADGCSSACSLANDAWKQQHNSLPQYWGGEIEFQQIMELKEHHRIRGLLDGERWTVIREEMTSSPLFPAWAKCCRWSSSLLKPY